MLGLLAIFAAAFGLSFAVDRAAIVAHRRWGRETNQSDSSGEKSKGERRDELRFCLTMLLALAPAALLLPWGPFPAARAWLTAAIGGGAWSKRAASALFGLGLAAPMSVRGLAELWRETWKLPISGAARGFLAAARTAVGIVVAAVGGGFAFGLAVESDVEPATLFWLVCAPTWGVEYLAARLMRKQAGRGAVLEMEDSPLRSELAAIGERLWGRSAKVVVLIGLPASPPATKRGRLVLAVEAAQRFEPEALSAAAALDMAVAGRTRSAGEVAKIGGLLFGAGALAMAALPRGSFLANAVMPVAMVGMLMLLGGLIGLLLRILFRTSRAYSSARFRDAFAAWRDAAPGADRSPERFLAAIGETHRLAFAGLKPREIARRLFLRDTFQPAPGSLYEAYQKGFEGYLELIGKTREEAHAIMLAAIERAESVKWPPVASEDTTQAQLVDGGESGSDAREPQVDEAVASEAAKGA